MSDEELARPVQSKWKPCGFELEGFDRIVVPVRRRIERTHGLRSVDRAIPFVDGEQIDETGLKAATWRVEAIFQNDLMDEPGIGSNPQLYPDRLEALEKIFEAKKTFTFDGLFKRNVRCKAIEWVRAATEDEGEAETLEITLKEDNESKLDAQRASGTSAHTNLNLQVEVAKFEAERAGMGGGSWEQLTEFVSQLETLINTPTEMRDNVLQKADRIVAACDLLLDATERNSEVVGFEDPATASAHRALFNLRSLVSRSAEQARDGRPVITVVHTTAPTNIWELAVEFGVDPLELLNLNPQIEDPNDIPGGEDINTPK